MWYNSIIESRGPSAGLVGEREGPGQEVPQRPAGALLGAYENSPIWPPSEAPWTYSVGLSGGWYA